MRWLLPMLLVPSIARAQQPTPCRPTPMGFACPGDLICDTKLDQCVERAQKPIPCQQSPNGFICPGDLICNGKYLCVAPPHHPHAEAMRNSGLVVTLVGTGFLVTAIAYFAQSHSCAQPFDIFGPRPDADCTIGYGLLIGSFPLFGFGIPFWAVGQHWLNRYPERAELFITPVDGGAMAGVRLINF